MHPVKSRNMPIEGKKQLQQSLSESNTYCMFIFYRSSHQRCFIKKGVLKNFAKFKGKHLYQSLFFNKVAGLSCSFCEFCEIFKNTFFSSSRTQFFLVISVRCMRDVFLLSATFFYKSQLFSRNHNFFPQTTTFFYKVQLFFPQYCDFFLQTTIFFYNIATFPKILRGLLRLNPGA